MLRNFLLSREGGGGSRQLGKMAEASGPKFQ